MNCWLLKADPEHDYSFDDLLNDGRADWTGVRNYQARNHLRAMEVGDLALIYHSGKEKRIVGVAKVTKAAFPDPTADAAEGWLAVELEPVEPLKMPVPLKTVKETAELNSMTLVKNSRLSCQDVKQDEFARILKMGGASRRPPRR